MKSTDLECEFMRRELMHEFIAREIRMNSSLPRALPRSREIRTRSHEIATHNYTPHEFRFHSAALARTNPIAAESLGAHPTQHAIYAHGTPHSLLSQEPIRSDPVSRHAPRPMSDQCTRCRIRSVHPMLATNFKSPMPISRRPLRMHPLFTAHARLARTASSRPSPVADG